MALLKCWYWVYRLPDSVPCVTALPDFNSPLHDVRPSFPKPFSHQVRCLRLALTTTPMAVCSHRIPKRMGYWMLPPIQICWLISNKEKSLPPTCYSPFVLKTLMNPRWPCSGVHGRTLPWAVAQSCPLSFWVAVFLVLLPPLWRSCQQFYLPFIIFLLSETHFIVLSESFRCSFSSGGF